VKHSSRPPATSLVNHIQWITYSGQFLFKLIPCLLIFHTYLVELSGRGEDQTKGLHLQRSTWIQEYRSRICLHLKLIFVYFLKSSSLYVNFLMAKYFDLHNISFHNVHFIKLYCIRLWQYHVTSITPEHWRSHNNEKETDVKWLHVKQILWKHEKENIFFESISFLYFYATSIFQLHLFIYFFFTFYIFQYEGVIGASSKREGVEGNRWCKQERDDE
jgi:hypothetical protein